MKFIVQGQQGFTAMIPDSLAEYENIPTANADRERLFSLYTIPGTTCNEHAHPVWTINGLGWNDITEYPVLGSTEIWTWHNQSGISHPMHMHLVAFQVLDRQAINEATGQPEGPIIQPAPYEIGWKDTAHSPPGYRTRVITKFDSYTGKYPYHCHILEHEDHEMMRQFEVQPCSVVSSPTGEGPGSLHYAINCAVAGDTIFFNESLEGDTIIMTDSIQIAKTITLYNDHDSIITLQGIQVPTLFDVQPNVTFMLKFISMVSGDQPGNIILTNRGTTILEDISMQKAGLPEPVLKNLGNLWIRGQNSITY